MLDSLPKNHRRNELCRMGGTVSFGRAEAFASPCYQRVKGRGLCCLAASRGSLLNLALQVQQVSEGFQVLGFNAHVCS